MDDYCHCKPVVSNYCSEPRPNTGLPYDTGEYGLRVCHTHNKEQNNLLSIFAYVFCLLAFCNHVLRVLCYSWLQFNPYFTFILFNAKPHLNPFLSQASQKWSQITEKRRQELSGMLWDATDSALCDDGAFYS